MCNQFEYWKIKNKNKQIKSLPIQENFPGLTAAVVESSKNTEQLNF